MRRPQNLEANGDRVDVVGEDIDRVKEVPLPGVLRDYGAHVHHIHLVQIVHVIHCVGNPGKHLPCRFVQFTLPFAAASDRSCSLDSPLKGGGLEVLPLRGRGL